MKRADPGSRSPTLSPKRRRKDGARGFSELVMKRADPGSRFPTLSPKRRRKDGARGFSELVMKSADPGSRSPTLVHPTDEALSWGPRKPKKSAAADGEGGAPSICGTNRHNHSPNSRRVRGSRRSRRASPRKLKPSTAPATAAAGKSTRWGESKDRKSTRLNSSHLGISYAVF